MTAADTTISTVATNVRVGLTSNLIPSYIFFGSVGDNPAMNIVTTISSNEVMNANTAPAHTPDRIGARGLTKTSATSTLPC